MADTKISALSAASSLAGTDVFPSVQTAGVGPVKSTLALITAFVLANAAAGTAAAPSITATGNTGAGIWFPSLNVMAFSTSASEAMRIFSNNSVSIGTTSNPARLAVTQGGAGTSCVYFTGVSGAKLIIDYAGNGTNIYDADTHLFRTKAGSNVAQIDVNGNFGVGTTSFGTSAVKVISIGNGTAPTTSPAGVGQLYVESGALKYRGSSGTITTIANA